MLALGKRGGDGEKKELSLFSLTPPSKPECLYVVYTYLLQITSKVHSVIYGTMLKTSPLVSFCNANKCVMYKVRRNKFGQKCEIRND